MAQFLNMFPVELEKGQPAIVSLAQMHQGNAKANRVGAIVFQGGQPAALGGSCVGTAIRADGNTVPLIGAISGNEAYVELDANCYAVEGTLKVFVTWVNGTNETTLLEGFGNVQRTSSGAVIQPAEPIPDLNQLLAEIDNMRQATSAANAAANSASYNILGAISSGNIAAAVYFEESDASGGDLYFKVGAFPIFGNGVTRYFPWSKIVSDLEATTVTTPKGISNCLKIPNNMALCIDLEQNKALYVDRAQTKKSMAVLFFNAYGRAENLHPTLLGAKCFQMANAISGLPVDVKKFGAIGDGATDDTQAIQNAIEYAHANGRDVFIPAGTYRLATCLFNAGTPGISHCLEVYSNQRVYGECGTVLMKGSNAANHFIFTHNESSAAGYTGAENIIIERITFDSNRGTYANANTPINISHANNVKIKNCIFRNSSGGWHSIEINSSRFVEVSGCEFLNNISNAEDIQIDAAIGQGNLGANDNTVCADVDINNCRFASAGSMPAIGNHTDAAHTNIRIHDNVFASASSSSQGIIDFVPHTKNVDVYNNTFSASSIGVRMQNATANSTVHDNRFENVTTPTSGGAIAYNNMINGDFVP